MKALIVDHEAAARERLRRAFEPAGATVVEAASIEEARSAADGLEADVVVVADAHAAVELFDLLPPSAVRIVTARPQELTLALAALDGGAFDALPRPLDAESCALSAWRACDELRARSEVARLEAELAERRAHLSDETAALETELAEEPGNDRSAAERGERAALALDTCVAPLPDDLDAVALLIEDPTTRSAVTDAAFAARQAQRLVRDLIDTDRSARGPLSASRRAVDGRALAEEVLAGVARIAADYDAVIDLDCPDPTGRCSTDPDLAGRILHNLLDTALRRARRGRVRFSVRGDEAGVCFAVSDGTPPPPERVMAALFDRRNRLESGTVQRGAALGFCRAAADALDAILEAEVPAEGGLRVSLTLPRPSPSEAELLAGAGGVTSEHAAEKRVA